MKLEPLRCALPAFQASVSTTQLREACEKARADGGRLVALWGSDETTRGAGYALHLALGLPAGLAWLTVPLEREQPRYPDLSDLFPAAIRMQRAAHDLVGIVPEGAKDLRKWLRHGAWAENAFPLRKTKENLLSRTAIPSYRSRAKACTRFRSARCTPAPSSRGTSASRSWARRCCGWRSGSATSTRASKNASRTSRSSKARGSPGAYRETRPSPSRGPGPWRSKARAAPSRRRARSSCAASCSSSSASPIISGTSATSATTSRSPSASSSSGA